MADWLALLESRLQPLDDRATYSLLAAFVKAAASAPPRLVLPDMPADAMARLGYLVFALRTMTHAWIHPDWEAFEAQAWAQRRHDVGMQLFACDDGDNPADEAARVWGFRAGLDAARLKQIVEHGAS